jgi:hypothetical protein
MAIEFSDKHGEIIIAIGDDSLLLVVVIVVSMDIFLTLVLGDLVFLSAAVAEVDVDGCFREEEDEVSIFFLFFLLFCLAADALDDDATDSVVPSSIDEFIDIILSSPPFINNSFVIPFLSLAGDGPRDADENCMGLSLSFFVDVGGGEGGRGDGAVHRA